MAATAQKITERADLSSTSGIPLLELLLKAGGDQLRLQVLQVLQHDAYGVLELCELFGIKQSAMSHHLKVLSTAGLVSTRREGNSIFYRRALPGSSENSQLLAQLFLTLDALPLDKDLEDAVDNAQQKRVLRSQLFFAENAERFNAQKELISTLDNYRDSVLELLETSYVSSACVLEIGPGEGSFLPDLARRFRQVIAVDNSPLMIQACRDRLDKEKLRNVRCIEASTISNDLVESGSVDVVIANMVLHHNAKPEDIFRQAHRVLANEGVFIVTELVQHDQDWVREAAGDVWLGFRSEQLDNWASSAGLVKGESNYNALRNGFSIQVHSYLKEPGTQY